MQENTYLEYTIKTKKLKWLTRLFPTTEISVSKERTWLNVVQDKNSSA
jgi:hypothetical protein